MSDLISRADAIDALGKEPKFKIKMIKTYAEGRSDQWFKDVATIASLPSAEPKTPSNGSITSINPENPHDRTMGGLINRQEATTIPVMPKEQREYQTMNLDDAYEQGWFDCQKSIEELPSAEPEIIRCKDCTHYDGRPCGLVNWYNGKEDFCSRAERRGDKVG